MTYRSCVRIATVAILCATAPAWADDSAAGAVLFKEARAAHKKRKGDRPAPATPG